MTKTRATGGLAAVRTSVRRIQTQGERMVGRLRRDAEALIARSRTELRKEVGDLERRVVKGFHAATAEQVARLERRVAKLERTIEEMGRKTAAVG
jgi:hypothetical protein